MHEYEGGHEWPHRLRQELEDVLVGHWQLAAQAKL